MHLYPIETAIETDKMQNMFSVGTVKDRDSKQVNILGVHIDCVDFVETLTLIQQWLEADPRATNRELKITHQICTVNPEFIIDARRDGNFAEVLAQASLCVPDGIGILLAARFFGIQLHERVTGSDGIYRISQRAAKRGWRLFLLGAAPGVAEHAARILQSQYPLLNVVGTYSGTPQDEEWPLIQGELTNTAPDILFVAFGHPYQDLWIAKHRKELPVRVAIGVGGAFDFVAGVVPRAPQWMRQSGLEWFYRLLCQPSRIGRMMKLPVFIGLVLRQRLFSD
ncbi:MAG: WecB/TagA/CpsF family glycosyltransferase [Chloroflexota bacterium]